MDDAYLWSVTHAAPAEEAVYKQLRKRLTRTLLTHSQESVLLPKSLFLTRIQCLDRETISDGQFADVYRGKFNGRDIALKRLRVFQIVSESKKHDLRKVRFQPYLGNYPLRLKY